MIYNFPGQLDTYKAKILQFREEYKIHIADLTAQLEQLEKKSLSTTCCHGNEQPTTEELDEKDKQIKKLDEDVNKVIRVVRKRDKEICMLEKALQECEGINFLMSYYSLARVRSYAC